VALGEANVHQELIAVYKPLRLGMWLIMLELLVAYHRLRLRAIMQVMPDSPKAKALLKLVDGTTYDAEINIDGGMNVEQKFLSRLQSDGGLWVDDADEEPLAHGLRLPKLRLRRHRRRTGPLDDQAVGSKAHYET
jgi:hypothetical protein